MASSPPTDGVRSQSLLPPLPEWLESLAGFGCWMIESTAGSPLSAEPMHWSCHSLVLLGQEQSPPATVADFIALCLGDDQSALETLLHDLASSSPERPKSCCCRLADPSSHLLIRVDAEVLIEADRRFLVGTLRDAGAAMSGLVLSTCQAEWLKTVASAGHVGTWQWPLPGDQLVWDSAMNRLYGLGPEPVVASYQAWIAALHPDDQDRIAEEIDATLRGERPFASRFGVIWPDGSIHQLLALAQTSVDPQGHPLRMVGVTIDLTEPLVQEQALVQARLERQAIQRAEAEAQALFRQTMHSAPVGMALYDPQRNRFQQVNPSLCTFFDRQEATLLTSSWHELSHPDDVNVDAVLARELRLGRLDSYRIRKRFLRPNGSVIWGDLSVAAIRDSDGKAHLILSQIIDISEMVHVQEQLTEQKLQLRLTLDSLLDPHLLLDVVRDDVGLVCDFRFADANETALHVLHTTKGKLLGSSLLAILPGIKDSPLMTLLLDAVDRGGYLLLDDVLDPTGRLVPVDGYVEVRAIRVNGVISLTWRDVTERHLIMQRMASSEQQHRLLTENSSDVVMLVRQGIIEWISPVLIRMLGWSPGRWVGHRFEQFVHPDDLALAQQCFQEHQHGDPRVTRLRLRDYRGQHHWVEAHASVISSESGQPDGIVASFRTVDQEVASEQALERRARFDDLTGLANRSEMLERFRLLLSSRPRRVPMAVLFIDIDQFKQINDRYGHAGGDCVLKMMAQRIRQTIRKRDWAARIGGDEMLVVLYGLNDLAKAMAIGEKIRVAAHAPICFGDHQITASISVGVTLATSAETVDAIIARADQAMYQAKQQGRDQVMAIPAAVA